MINKNKEVIFIDNNFNEETLIMKIRDNLRNLINFFNDNNVINVYSDYNIAIISCLLAIVNNFNINTNIELLKEIYQKINNDYKKYIDSFEQENKNLQNRNNSIEFYSIYFIFNKILYNNEKIITLNSKKISKWKNSLIIIFTLGFYNKNKKIIKKVEEYKNKNIKCKKDIFILKKEKLKNIKNIKNILKAKKVIGKNYNLIKKTLNECIICCDKIQDLQSKNKNFDCKSINEIKLESQKLTNKCKQYSL